MRNPNLVKYFQYPFIACAVCGPRYTTVTELPYDRERSTMNNFPFCQQTEPESCIQEYSDFNNRRFHAQPNACKDCGPHISLYDNVRKKVATPNPIEKVATLLKQGYIVAVKGLGGFHLAADAENN